MRISDWSSDVCPSDLARWAAPTRREAGSPMRSGVRLAWGCCWSCCSWSGCTPPRPCAPSDSQPGAAAAMRHLLENTMYNDKDGLCGLGEQLTRILGDAYPPGLIIEDEKVMGVPADTHN